MQKKWRGRGSRAVGSQDGCEWRSEVFAKMRKNWGGGVLLVGVRVGWISEVSNSNRGVESRGGGGQGGCERRIKVFVEIKKKLGGGGWGRVGGVWVDVNKELKLL